MKIDSVRMGSFAIAAVGIAVLLSGSVQAKGFESFSYSANFVCGINPQALPRVLPGEYATAVNVHNPSGRRVSLTARVSLTFPPGALGGGLVSEEVEVSLDPRQALQLDCDDLFDGTFLGEVDLPPYTQGFMVVHSARRLEVQAFQTARTLEGDLVSATSVVVPERRLLRGRVIY